VVKPRNSKAVIVIGDNYTYDIVDIADIYYFPDDVSEWELAEEIANLVEFYDELVYPVYWPPHIRKEKVIAWINAHAQTLMSDITPCRNDGQCNINCYFYSKGGCQNGTNE
jgi:hypothetical protein